MMDPRVTPTTVGGLSLYAALLAVGWTDAQLAAHGYSNPEIGPAPTGPTDTQRLEWVLPLLSLDDGDGAPGNRRTVALASALVLGKSGRDAIDFAMEGFPK